MAEKETERIKAFKNDPNSVWLRMIHWRIIDGVLTLCAGGLFDQADYDKVHKYFKGKKLL